MDEEELITPDELAEYLRVPKSWVYDSVQTRDLPHLRLNNRRLRFKMSEVTQWLAAQTMAAHKRRRQDFKDSIK